MKDYSKFEGPSREEEAAAFKRKNRMRRIAECVASNIMAGGDQIHTSQRMMKHKSRGISGIRIR